MSISIDPSPEARADNHYRYRMPPLETKPEGSGNGVKTVIPNIHAICEAIGRPEISVMTFLQSSLGVKMQISEKDDKYLVMGTHMREDLQNLLDKFIKLFVLCPSCNNPETYFIVVRKNTALQQVCGACSKKEVLETSEKKTQQVLIKYYVDHPEAQKAAKHAAQATQEDTKEKEKGGTVDDVAIASVEEEKMWVTVSKYMIQNPDNIQGIIEKIISIASEQMVEEYTLGTLVFKTLQEYCKATNTEDQFFTITRKYAPLYLRFTRVSPSVTDSVEDGMRKAEAREYATTEFLLNVMRAEFEKNIDQFVIYLFLLFIEGAIRDKWIGKYLNDVQAKYAKKQKPRDGELLEKTATLMKWLDLVEEPEENPEKEENGAEGETGEEVEEDKKKGKGAKKEKKAKRAKETL